MSHKDGPLYHGFVISISLGNQVIFKFTKDDEVV